MKTIYELFELVNQVNLRAYKIASEKSGIALEVNFAWHVNQMEVREFTLTNDEWHYANTTCFRLDTEEDIQAAYWFLKTQIFAI